jgi:hypothetical protein
MSAGAIWHTLMEAAPRDDRDKMPGYFAAGCTCTLTPPGTTSGFTSRGAAGAERAARFARKIKAAGPGADDLAGQFLTGPGSEGPTCFTCHIDASGLTGRVNQYAAMPGLAA